MKMTATPHTPHLRRVLIVDDLEDNRTLLKFLLQRKGINVLEAKDGVEAVNMACQQRPDAILMDLSMPIMDGFEATRQIKGLEATRHIPVAAVSAHCGEGESRDKALAAGCLICFEKPIEWEKLDVFLGTI